ncbi:hypothetical protein [Paracraurococcus lichenis]|uniref:YfiR family protein n=1 Tax=Paracraurococcus lichenis TaxID=3064888 RepID=A0ABT9E448_9PROT|nr:hypothetical protein [Paracraurococcus sp. LOR1-02]MDO9710950.1 hypothetical protein [Paracraurococcus sp. LOR1-02]
MGIAALCGLIALCLGAPPATAETTARDLQVLARALGFLDRAPKGTGELGIVYPAASPAAKAEAERVAALCGDGLRAGALTLHPRLVPAEAAGQAQVAALLLTEAALPEAGQIAGALAGRGIPLIATTPAALDGNRVVMAVRSEPRVEILVSRAAAQAAGVTFSAAFRMMIQER